MPKLKFIQAIVSCRIMNFIRNGDTIINVDEATFTQKIQQHYSWLPKGKTSSIINIKWRGSFSMIFALHNDWNWIWMILKSTITSQKFWWFLMILKDYTEEVLRKNTDMVKITSDNTRIHLAIKTQIATGYLKLNMHMLSPYSPTCSRWVGIRNDQEDYFEIEMCHNDRFFKEIRRDYNPSSLTKN